MQLPAELFERLTGSPVPQPGSGDHPGAERRQHGRVQLGRRAQVRLGDGPWQTVLVRDISVVGIGFLCDAALPTGQLFTLRLTDTDDQAVCVTCIVHRCEPGGVGGVAFFVGSTFECLTDAATANANSAAVDHPLITPPAHSFWRRIGDRLLHPAR